MAKLSNSNQTVESKLPVEAVSTPSKIQTASRLEFFSRTTEAIASELDPERALYAVTDEVFNYFQPRGCSIMIRQGDIVQVIAGRSVSQQKGRLGRPKDLPSFKLGEGIAGKAALLGEPVWVENTAVGSEFYKIPGKTSKIGAILAVPMKVRGNVTGVINVAYSEQHHFTEEEIETLRIIAAPAAFAIQNAQLFAGIEDERQKLELILETVQAGVTVHKRDGQIVLINRAAKDMYGVVGNIYNKSILELVTHQEKYLQHKAKLDFNVTEVVNVILRGKTFKSTIEVDSSPKRVVQIIANPMRSSEGKTIGIVANHRDISDNVLETAKAEAQLTDVHEQRERWQAIFENVEEAIVVIDRNGKIVQANSASEIIAGASRKDILSMQIDDVFALVNEKGVALSGELSPFQSALQTKEKLEYLQAKFTNKEGREVWVGVSITPISVHNDNVDDDQLVAVVRDISKLIEIDHAKTDFVSMASHELRTPLTVINGYISLFTSGDLGDIDKPELAHFRQVFNQIQKNTTRLNRLVEDLLNVSRIEQGRMDFNFEKVNLELLVKEVVEEMKMHASSKNHNLQFVSYNRGFLDLPIIINADYEKIKEVMINLIDNAIKYTHAGGEISVNVRKTSDKAQISVKDNGTGIPKQLIPRIFEKFQRLEGSYVKDTVGTGLGLYIVRELVRGQGGDVLVESKIGEGSTFIISLPLK